MRPVSRPVRITRRALTTAVVGLAAVLLFTTPAAAAAAAPPSSMASLGDSITRGFNACGFYVDCPSRSFATGDYAPVDSQATRITAKNAALAGHAFNDAKSGAKAADMPGQAATAVSQRVQYVTMLIGGNDACTPTEAAMTTVAAYRASIDAALATIKAGLPAARVELVSIPDVKRLWAAGRGSAGALSAWWLFHICQSLLANPTSDAPADAARRDRVRQRVVDYNAQLAAACAAYGPNCAYDGGAVFSYPFSLSQISPWDYFHPNPAGQQILAQLSYVDGFNF
jgi:lysophospholipase L1-like esterase